MLNIVLVFSLVLNVSTVFTKSVSRYCGTKKIQEILKKEGVYYIRENIYNVSKILEIDALENLKKSIKKESYKKNASLSKQYRLTIGQKLLPDTCVKKVSAAVGYGLFANEKIHKNQLIGEYTGVVEYSKNVKNKKYSFAFPIKIKQNRISLDSYKYGNEMRLINHSDSPNAEALYIVIDHKYRLIIRAKKYIKPGGQIYIDYGKNYWHKKSGRRKLNLT